MSAPEEPQPYRILVYGIEMKGLPLPKDPIVSRKYTLEFVPRDSALRFQDFDGAILFQGTFESFEWISDRYKSHLKHSCAHNELDKRTKEADSLFEQGGFMCLLLSDPFVEFDEKGRDFRNTDLSKRLLGGFNVDQRSFRVRQTNIRSSVDELRKFFELYGAACHSLNFLGADRSIKTLAFVDQRPVSLSKHGQIFLIPTLIPKSTEEAVREYLTILADGIVTLWDRLKVALPDWANDYRFPGEEDMLTGKASFSQEIAEIDTRLKELEQLKRILVLQGEPLVDAVRDVFDKALPLKAKHEEAFREDLILVDSEGEKVALVEVKGVTRGVTREHVNQADSHRERNGLLPEFPSLLIVNTNIKNSTSIADKDQTVASEQVQHAARNNVLILRTLDLLNLASLHLKGTYSSKEVVEMLTKSRGWLKVGDAPEVLYK